MSPAKLALAEIRRLRARLERVERREREPIAIVGMGVRFPGGACDVESFHQQLSNGLNAIRTVPADRWDAERYFSTDRDAAGTMYTLEGGFLDNVADFDPEFFGISPVEAATIDPQQRLLLEVCWEALEYAGIPATALRGTRTGVYLGIAANDYGRMSLADAQSIDEYASLGTAFSVAGGRLSYVLGLHGPAVSVDTACSGSLVALHLACQALHNGECDAALAAGVNLILSPEITINFCRAGMLAEDGQCKTFDAGADGYVRSEGCAVVMLKRLSDAQRDGDRVLALVRGSAVNQDGRSSGLTAPNGPAQEMVIRAALEDAGVRPGQVGYVEAHGTGTSLGDPIELQALGNVFGGDRPSERPLWVGSVKTNVGHLEAAAGMAGLVKTVQALRHGVLPPHRNFTTPNPHVDWQRLPLRVPASVTPFERIDGRRLAGLSSFGFSGTNVHVILEEPPESGDDTDALRLERPQHVLALSAPRPDALRELATRYVAHLPGVTAAFADICHTANAGRSHFRHRLAVVAADAVEAVAALRAWLDGQPHANLVAGDVGSGGKPALALVCAATAPDAALVSALREAVPHYADALDGSQDARAAQLALGDVWRRWGVHPDFVLNAPVDVESARRDGVAWFVELAPGAATFAPRPGELRIGAPAAASDVWSTLLRGVAALYVAGGDIAWRELDRGFVRRRVDLPRYPFQRRRFWLPTVPQGGDAGERWNRVTAAVQERAQLAPIDLNLPSYPDKWRALEELTRELGRNVLATLDAFAPGDERSVEQVLDRCGIGALYRPIVERWLDALTADGTLVRTAEGYRAVAPLEPAALDALWARVEALLADNAPLLAYLHNCAGLLSDVLTGRASPLETLFPGGSFELATALYERSSVMRYVNGIAATALRSFAEQGTGPLRILEFGAGTGGTTSSLLPVLPAARTQYDFTDVSDLFLAQAAERFRAFPFLRTGVFDLEKDVADQGYTPGSYDIVIGANVLHAARDLRASLARVQSLLAPGGMLMLIESTGHLAWHDISTGLIEGWQHFTDDLRNDTPLLGADRWIELLREAGFEEAVAEPALDSIADVLKQHVLIARRSSDAVRAVVSPVAVTAVKSAAAPMPAVPQAVDSAFLGELRHALSGEREDIAANAVRACVVDVLHLDADRPPARDARLMDLGVDSLLAVRLRNVLQKRLQLPGKLPSTLIFDYPTIDRIAALIVERYAAVEPAVRADATAADRAAAVAALSDEEAEALLLARLDGGNLS
jgi:3-oxoacyl-(acyl-carrier-protein) synthase/SAM-dependent methyltransferase